jgi:Putative peptidoglycan binding domain
VKLIGDQKCDYFLTAPAATVYAKGNMIYMRLITNFIAGLLLNGILAPAGYFIRSRRRWGQRRALWGRWRWPLWRVHGGFGGFEAVGHAFHGPIAQGGRNVGGWPHHAYSGYYGYYGPFDYGFDGYNDYAGPYYDDGHSFDVQPASSYVAPDEPASLFMSVQKELAQLGYYHGPIDSIAGSKTEQAVRWFQSVDHLPLTGHIDSATLQALRIA